MFELRVFGGLTLTSDAAPLPAAAHQRRRLTLLVRLAAAGAAGVSRDRLLALLWPENPSARAQHALDQLLYATRRDLGKGAVVQEGGQLRVDPEIVSSDVARFEACLRRGDRAGAVELYGGPFLDGVHLGGGAELEQWVDGERARLQGCLVEALETLAREAADRRDAAGRLAWWRRRAAAEPLSARGACGLLEALLAAGEHTGALQYVRSYTTLIRQELGAEPDPQFLALADHLLSGPPARLAAAPAAALASPEPGLTAFPAPRASGAEARIAPAARPGPARWFRVRAGRAPLLLLAGGVAMLVAIGLGLRRSAPPANPESVRSIAVLPFENLSGDPAANYLAEGLSEELIHALAQLPDLDVVARTSAFAFRNRATDIREIGRSLGVAAVMEGSLRPQGDRLRVTIQLIDAATGYHLWSGSYDQPAGDALKMQDAIAGSVVAVLRPELRRPAPTAAASPPGSARAYHLYLQGRYALNQQTESALRDAVRLFEASIAEEGSHPAAHAGLADALDALVDGGFAEEEAGYRAAEAAARRAIALDSGFADGHASLGHLKFHRWDWAGAERDLRRALRLAPGSSAAHARLAVPLVMQGQFDEGLALMRRAQELDPLALGIRGTAGWLLFLAGRNAEAMEELRLVIAMDSLRASAHARLGLTLIETGRYEQGLGSLERAVTLGGDYYRSALPMLGYGYARAGRHEAAEQIRARIEREAESRAINPYYEAAFMAALGDRDDAFAVLDRAYRANRGCLIDLQVDPLMGPLRADQRYARLVRALRTTPPPPDGAG